MRKKKNKTKTKKASFTVSKTMINLSLTLSTSHFNPPLEWNPTLFGKMASRVSAGLCVRDCNLGRCNASTTLRIVFIMTPIITNNNLIKSEAYTTEHVLYELGRPIMKLNQIKSIQIGHCLCISSTVSFSNHRSFLEKQRVSPS